MVKRCIAAGCSNTYRENVSLFCFPRDSALKVRWTKQVRRTRSGWSGSTANSYLCSDHFSEDCGIPSWQLSLEYRSGKSLNATQYQKYSREISNTQPLLPKRELDPASQTANKWPRNQDLVMTREKEQG